MFFKEDHWYENRRGKYQVIQIDEGSMVIRYKSGKKQRITNLDLQKRIVRNIREEKSTISSSCLCSWNDEVILANIIEESLPSYALLNGCCWRRICQVRGRNFKKVGDETWASICSRRGYLQERQNPRGF